MLARAAVPQEAAAAAVAALVALVLASGRCGATRLLQQQQQHHHQHPATAAAVVQAALAALVAATRTAWVDLVPAALADCQARSTLVHRLAAVAEAEAAATDPPLLGLQNCGLTN